MPLSPGSPSLVPSPNILQEIEPGNLGEGGWSRWLLYMSQCDYNLFGSNFPTFVVRHILGSAAPSYTWEQFLTNGRADSLLDSIILAIHTTAMECGHGTTGYYHMKDSAIWLVLVYFRSQKATAVASNVTMTYVSHQQWKWKLEQKIGTGYKARDHLHRLPQVFMKKDGESNPSQVWVFWWERCGSYLVSLGQVVDIGCPTVEEEYEKHVTIHTAKSLYGKCNGHAHHQNL